MLRTRCWSVFPSRFESGLPLHVFNYLHEPIHPVLRLCSEVWPSLTNYCRHGVNRAKGLLRL
jgi:hypothetical protein